MSSHTQSRDTRHDDKQREQRLANLSGAMALARLTHQVKELELQKDKRDNQAEPTFSAFDCIMYPTQSYVLICSDTGILVSMLESVKRWSGEGGVNIIVPLSVLDELDKSKKGTDAINVKTREAIRYLDRRSKARHSVRTAPKCPTLGSLRMQAPEEMYSTWEECNKLRNESERDSLSKDEIPRHFRAMINCALYQRSKGNECPIVTEDADLGSFVERWNISIMTTDDLENTSRKALDRYRKDMKAYEGHKRTSRNSPPAQRVLWTPPK